MINVNINDNWNELIKRFQSLDIYYSQEYVSLSADIEKGEPEAFFLENEWGRLFYPYVKRKIDVNKNYYDIITPYGYGGPMYEGDKRILNQFYSEFKKYCIDHDIITETIRLHPLLNITDEVRKIIPVGFIRNTTAVDLREPLEKIKNNYSSSNKRNINKAIKEGVRAVVSNDKKDIEVFIELYYETMDRNKATPFYYFNKSYFCRLMEETELSKPYLLFAEKDGKKIAGLIVIMGKEFAHYHLGASKTEFLNYRPNNLLFDKMIELSKSMNLKALHLGGGYTDNDSLFKFKTSFTNNFNFEYYLGKHILNKSVYKDLSKVVKNSLKTSSDNSYFPQYRMNG
ncbi:hypothetical protein BLX88_09465 [Bacillus obstructivus]|uniref:lipid II:glycine glycyltransferase FemX n=1 Tax=Heyndrickxia oleronia TaxID=38875 RepID=UPI000903A77F|nr:hypothetical protein BLX88_09465 [Bacillus obstructivus]